MNETMTSARARTGSMDALAASLAVLDTGTRLERIHPTFPRSQLGVGKFEPCYDDNATIDGPQRFSVGYWVVGGDGRATMKLLADLWAEWGWIVDERSGHGVESVRATSPEGYRLIARASVDGDVSLGVSSPCFAFDNGTDLGDARAPHSIGQR